MDERKISEAPAAEIEGAAASGDRDRPAKLADVHGNEMARISGDIVAAGSADSIAVPFRGPEQLAPVARRISTEALAAELAAERGDWDTVHATYDRLAVLFAEYRLLYLQCLGT